MRSKPRLACHYWSVYHLEIEDACRWARETGYEGMDLGSGDLGAGARLDPAQLAHDGTTAERLRRAAVDAGIVYTDLFLALPFAANDPDPAHQAANLDLLRAVVAVAPRAGIPILTMSPGFTGTDAWEDAFARSGAALREWVAAGQNHGVAIAVEAHLESVADTPERTQALIDAVPGLALTLDYSHFIAGGHTQESIEPLHRHAAHVHIRQSRPGVLAAPVSEGVIDVRRVLARLHADGYGGAITVEYVSSPWQGQDQVDSSTENERMRRQIRGLIDEVWGQSG
jgi:sugar phosphate isomerase/epimerase